MRSGINYEDLNKLSIIHVSGTKGKVCEETIYSKYSQILIESFQGSTCALTESILRSYGLRTGFFSSPHLVSATERFRLSGRPISQEKFSKYFWQVYNLLDKHKVSRKLEQKKNMTKMTCQPLTWFIKRRKKKLDKPILYYLQDFFFFFVIVYIFHDFVNGI